MACLPETLGGRDKELSRPSVTLQPWSVICGCTCDEKELRRLVLELQDHDYFIFEDSPDESRSVQYLVHDAAVYGEVGSRHWLPESERLRKESVTALGCLGFEGGGLRRNFSRDHLPHDPRRLACLTEVLFGAAYGGVGEMTPLVRIRASREAECPPPAIEFDA